MVWNEDSCSRPGRQAVLRGMPLFLGLVAIVAVQSAWSATYRWVDEQGRVHYSDTIPSQGQTQKQLDKQGRVLEPAKPKQATPTATPISPEVEAQKRRDRALLSTYVNEAEIDLTRDRAMTIEQTTLKGLQTRLDNAKQGLARINGQTAELRKQGRLVPAGLQQMHNEAQNEVNSLTGMTQRSSQVVESIRARYDADKARYRELKAQQP